MVQDLVLGGSGFIGGHLTAALARAGRSVTTVGRRFSSPAVGLSVTQREVDLYACSSAELKSLVQDVEIVYHLAWSTISATAEEDPSGDLVGNVGFFVRLLDCLKRTGTRIIFCSSGGTIYGPSACERIPEDHPLRPITAYGAGKAAAESYAEFFRRTYGMDARIARLANPYGMGQDPDRLQGALTRFAARMVKGLPVEIWGDGSVVRDYVYVDDAVQALQGLAQAPREFLGDEPVFNVGSGCGTSLRELIAIIEDQLRTPIQITYGLARRIDVKRNVLDIGKIERNLGWRPNLTLREGIALLLYELKHEKKG